MLKKRKAIRAVHMLAGAAALVFTLLCVFAAAACTKEPAEAAALSFVSDQTPALRFSCWVSPADGEAYLYLPAGVSCGDLTPVFSARKAAVNGKAIVSGEKTDVFDGGRAVTVKLDARSFRLHFLEASQLPAVLIETDSGALDAIHKDKSYKEGGTLTVLENGAVTLNAGKLDYIKGRGNTTWDADKKPYNLKFSKKTELFGMSAAKKWCLLANAFDPTLLHNAVAYSLAQKTSIPYTVEYQMVDLFINGDYRGNYMLTEKVEVGEERVDINDLDKANEAANPGVETDMLKTAVSQPSGVSKEKNGLAPGLKKYTEWKDSPSDISGGYLLEFSKSGEFNDEDGGFVTNAGNCLVLKSPERASLKEVEYIAEAYQAVEDAVLSKDGTTADGQRYSELLDMPSAADSYLLLEFTQDMDSGFYSWFLYKEQGDPLFYAGPAWDFDVSMENDDGELMASARYYTAMAPEGEIDEKEKEYVGGAIYRDLPRHTDFWALAYERWQPLAEYVKGGLTDRIRRLRDTVEYSAVADAMRWMDAADENGMQIAGDSPKQKREHWNAATDNLLAYLSSRADTMLTGLADPAGALEKEKLARAEEDDPKK